MARALVGLVTALGAVWALRLILGPWPAALVLAPVGVAAVIAGWALLERRMSAPPPPLPVRQVGPVIDVDARR